MRFISLIVFLMVANVLTAQPPMQKDFISFQKSFQRVDDAFFKKEETLKAEFAAKGFEWPAKYMYIRSFKLDSKLEIWVKNSASEPYKKFKTYKVCALAGGLGPKRYQGDYQVPEGFYYINEFKPNSQYHLALGVNYPNASDRILSDKAKPGGEIFIHGSCVTVGCIPLTDPIIEEVYVLAASTKAAGQDFIPLHVFPISFKSDKSKETLDKYLEQQPDYKPLAHRLEKVYYYFEEKKQLPTIVINAAGEYDMLQEFTIPKRPVKPLPPPPFKENSVARKPAGRTRDFSEEELKQFIIKHPEFPGGNPAFQVFLEALGQDLAKYMPSGKKRAFVQVEFVVGSDGKVYNVQVDKQANNEMNNTIIERFEGLENWKPALGQKDKPLPRKLVQTVIVNAVEEEKPVVKVQEEED
jgi:murein L,D-transpeptidase YafK